MSGFHVENIEAIFNEVRPRKQEIPFQCHAFDLRRAADDTPILRARANWVFLNTETMQPQRLPDEFLDSFQPDEEIEEVSREDIVRLIDEQARRRRGISAAELLSAYRAGRLGATGDVADLLVYSDLLSPQDPIFESAARKREACLSHG